MKKYKNNSYLSSVEVLLVADKCPGSREVVGELLFNS